MPMKALLDKLSVMLSPDSALLADRGREVALFWRGPNKSLIVLNVIKEHGVAQAYIGMDVSYLMSLSALYIQAIGGVHRRISALRISEIQEIDLHYHPIYRLDVVPLGRGRPIHSANLIAERFTAISDWSGLSDCERCAFDYDQPTTSRSYFDLVANREFFPAGGSFFHGLFCRKLVGWDEQRVIDDLKRFKPRHLHDVTIAWYDKQALETSRWFDENRDDIYSWLEAHGLASQLPAKWPE